MKNIGGVILATGAVLLFAVPPAEAFQRHRSASGEPRIELAKSHGGGAPRFRARGGPSRQGAWSAGRHRGSGRHHQLRRHQSVRRPHVAAAPRFRHHGVTRPPGFRVRQPRVHVFLGVGPLWPPPPRVVVPPVVIQRPAPVYIEAPPQYWYYCESARAYYPYVGECPEPWIPVVPYPPGTTSE
jgi:hypothetical protein